MPGLVGIPVSLSNFLDQGLPEANKLCQKSTSSRGSSATSVELVAGPLAIPFHLQIVNGDPLIPNQIGPPQPKRSCSLFWLRSHCLKRLGASLSPRAEIPEPACLCMEMPYTWTHEHTTHCDVIPRSSGLCKTSDTKNTLLKIMSLSFW